MGVADDRDQTAIGIYIKKLLHIVGGVRQPGSKSGNKLLGTVIILVVQPGPEIG